MGEIPDILPPALLNRQRHQRANAFLHERKEESNVERAINRFPNDPGAGLKRTKMSRGRSSPPLQLVNSAGGIRSVADIER